MTEETDWWLANLVLVGGELVSEGSVPIVNIQGVFQELAWHELVVNGLSVSGVRSRLEVNKC